MNGPETASTVKRNEWGHMVLKEHNQLLEAEDDLLVGSMTTDEFQEHDDHYCAAINPQISLAQVIRQAKKLPDCDFNKVTFFWTKYGFFMSVAKS